jgi:hypothetical protein
VLGADERVQSEGQERPGRSGLQYDVTFSSLVLVHRFWFNGSVPKPQRSLDISEAQLRSWDLLGEFRTVLAKSTPTGRKDRRKGGPARLLDEVDYFCAFLFAQFNPVIDSMRGLCACSNLERVQQEVCSRPISLGSFSEAQSVFGYERLEEVFQGLVEENLRSCAAGTSALGKAPAALHLVDSSVFRAVPRMCWAQWRHQKTTQRAVRLHLKFNLFDAQPSEVLVTEGRFCERKALAKLISPGEFYVGDRYYGRDYKLLKTLEETECDFIIRLCENAILTVVEELPLDAEDKAAGVVSDQIARLGAREREHHGPVRVVRIEKPELGEPVILVTNQLDRECFSAALIAEVYHQRWAIELFFRWFKCVLGRADNWHWLAESSEGVAIQLYSALIAALLLARQLGRLPSKRCMEMLRFHSMGMASQDELDAVIEAEVRKRSR